jgi:hypothetical protein
MGTRRANATFSRPIGDTERSIGSPVWPTQCQTVCVPSFDGELLTEMLIAFAMIGLLGVVLRWTFSRSKDAENAIWPTGDPDDFGLLAPVATVDTEAEAQNLRSTLALAGIKATTTPGPDGRYRVLVFASEVDRARRVGGWSA